jgi:hypothetical protein
MSIENISIDMTTLETPALAEDFSCRKRKRSTSASSHAYGNESIEHARHRLDKILARDEIRYEQARIKAQTQLETQMAKHIRQRIDL